MWAIQDKKEGTIIRTHTTKIMGKNLSSQDASLVNTFKELPEGKRLVLALVTTLCHYNSALLEMVLKT